jgi:L-alanine-DL-glutamate epimerase-like enolase superfamily enzyme
MARLRNETDVAIAADEPAYDVPTARATILARACDVLVLKPMVVGGLDRALTIAELAHREAVDVVVTTTIDAAVARAGALHLAAALGDDNRAHGLATGCLLAEEPASFDERIEDGHMPVPSERGHGARRETGESKLRTGGS